MRVAPLANFRPTCHRNRGLSVSGTTGRERVWSERREDKKCFCIKAPVGPRPSFKRSSRVSRHPCHFFILFCVCVCVPAFDGARLPFWTLNYLQVFSVPSTGRAREDPTLAMQLLQVWSRETNKNAEDRFLPFLLLKAVRAEESSTVGKSCSPPLSSYCLTFLREGSPYGFLLPLPWGALNQRNSTARGNHSPSPEGWGGVVGVSPMMSFCRSVASV